MNFIRKVSSTETDIQFALCNSSVYLQKSALSFFSGNIEVKSANIPGLNKNKKFSFTGTNDFLKLSSTGEIGYFHISSYALSPEQTSQTSLKPPRFTILTFDQLEDLKIRDSSIIGFTSSFFISGDSQPTHKFFNSDDYCSVSFKFASTMQGTPENMKKIDKLDEETRKKVEDEMRLVLQEDTEKLSKH